MSQVKVAYVLKLLRLPKYLQQTALALLKLGYADATQVAVEIGKSRAQTSVCLNMLVILNLATKKRVHRKNFFMPQNE